MYLILSTNGAQWRMQLTLALESTIMRAKQTESEGRSVQPSIYNISPINKPDVLVLPHSCTLFPLVLQVLPQTAMRLIEYILDCRHIEHEVDSPRLQFSKATFWAKSNSDAGVAGNGVDFLFGRR